MEKLLTINDISDILKIKIDTIYKYVQKDKIPYVKINGNLRFREKDIDNLLKKNNIKSKNIKKIDFSKWIDIPLDNVAVDCKFDRKYLYSDN